MDCLSTASNLAEEIRDGCVHGFTGSLVSSTWAFAVGGAGMLDGFWATKQGASSSTSSLWCSEKSAAQNGRFLDLLVIKYSTGALHSSYWVLA